MRYIQQFSNDPNIPKQERVRVALKGQSFWDSIRLSDPDSAVPRNACRLPLSSGTCPTSAGSVSRLRPALPLPFWFTIKKLTVNSAIFGTRNFPLFFCSGWYSVLVFTITCNGQPALAHAQT